MIKASVLLLAAAFIAFWFSVEGWLSQLVPESLLAAGLVLALLSIVNREKAPRL